jgi:hypothetical protein
MLRAFVKVDRATMGPERLAAKLPAYERLHRYVPAAPGRRPTLQEPGLEEWRRRYPLFPRILFVLDGTGPAGVENRIAALLAAGRWRRPSFTRFPSLPRPWPTCSSTVLPHCTAPRPRPRPASGLDCSPGIGRRDARPLPANTPAEVLVSRGRGCVRRPGTWSGRGCSRTRTQLSSVTGSFRCHRQVRALTEHVFVRIHQGLESSPDGRGFAILD